MIHATIDNSSFAADRLIKGRSQMMSPYDMPITGPMMGERSMLLITVVAEFVASPSPATTLATVRRQQ